jgi:hypothetical protein
MRQPEIPKRVKVGDIVLAKLGSVGPATECKIERLTVVSTGRSRDEAELFLVRQLYKVRLLTSGRKLSGPEDYSVGPWEPGGRVVELPGDVIESVVDA